MYNISKITDRFSSVVGYSQVTDPDISKYSDELIATESSLVIQNFHPLLVDETIQRIIPFFSGYSHDEWLATKSYLEGDIIEYDKVFYIATADNMASQPDALTDWEVKDYKSEYLTQLNKDSDTKLLNSVLLQNSVTTANKSLLESVSIITGSGRINDRNVMQSRFVGIEITPRRQKGITISINQIGLQFTETQTDLPIYIFHTSSLEPIYSTTVSTTSANTFQWVKLDAEIAYNSDDYDAGGTFYLGYFEDDVNGQSIRKFHDFTRSPSYCSGCGNQGLTNFKAYNRHFTLRAVSVASDKLNGAELWDINNNQYESQNNFGLNLKMTAKCDITDVVLDNAPIWANAIATQRAVLLLEKIAFNTRDNGLAEKTKNMALMDLKGNPERGVQGLYSVLAKEIKKLNFDLSDLNSVCFPKKIKGARRTTI